MKNLSGLLAVLALFLCASISNAQSNYVKRINCGDTNATTHNGETYDADDETGYTYTGNNTATPGHSGFTLDTNPGEIFALTRYTGGTTSMEYDFPVLDGEYDVVLHWAEPYHGPGLSGQPADYRQFDVEINGVIKEDNLKVFVVAGINTPLVRTYRVTAMGGTGISIEFIDQNANDPIINAIEVLGVAASPPPSNGDAISVTGDNVTGSVNGFNNKIELIDNSSAAIVFNPGQTSELMFGLNQNGNFYWGTGGNTATNPNYYSMFLNGNNGDLGIRGKLTSKEVKVDIDGWADYVFSADYTLPTLEEVEQHIKKEGHLINIPTATEVKANGIELGEMNKLLLEKIEELTLYVIQMQKQIDDLKED